MGNQATPVIETAPHTEPDRLGNTEIIAEVAKLSSELQRRFWKLYDSYAGRYPRRELLWLAWQSLQDEIRRGVVPIDTALTLDADQTNSEPATPGSAERSQPEQPKSGRELQPVTPDQAIRAKLDALVNQLSPELRKRYWELHSDYCVRRYPYLDARQCAWRDLQLEIERGRISAPEPASASATTAVEPDTPSELPGNASPSPRQELPTATVENHADIADVIRQCGQVLGAKTIREGTSPELADILPAETDAELAQLGAEIAKHLEAAENSTEESDTSQIFQAVSYSVPQTETESGHWAAERVHTDENGTGVGAEKEPGRADADWGKTWLKRGSPMASLYKDPRSGTYVIQFFDHEGIRRTLRTGVTDRQGAEHIRWHIDNLLAAKRAAIPLPAATAEWLGRIDAQFRAKLETLGLVEPRAERRVPTLGQLIDEFIEYQKPRVKAADAEGVASRPQATTYLPASRYANRPHHPRGRRQGLPGIQKPASAVNRE
jgi:hypothetical protein